ncbi:uncharacterized protein TNCV_2138811 [Trichonephila clavipes]|uniref:Uncharacterized protein n=1 Tax=Trichonephila clavipes TaxID=2585209 RepID=A0A8X6S4R0_TRICX|nr:uncharacterized protein TNCV_2138811 [Trichonephila clavipes]
MFSEVPLDMQEVVDRLELVYKNFTSKLKTEAKFKIFSLTITGNASSLLNDSQFQKTWNNIDFLTFDPSYASHGSKESPDVYFDVTRTIDLVLARGFPRSKLLLPISLLKSLEKITNESFVDGMYPKFDQTRRLPNFPSQMICSIGGKSGDRAGQGRVVMWRRQSCDVLVVCGRALSC